MSKAWPGKEDGLKRACGEQEECVEDAFPQVVVGGGEHDYQFQQERSNKNLFKYKTNFNLHILHVEVVLLSWPRSSFFGNTI